MTQHPDLFAALAAPFEPSEVKVRSQSGRQLNYVTARTVMNRLDEVLGPENWWDEYLAGENSVLCKLTVRLPDGATLTKCDAGGYAGMADQGDDDKSGYSDSFKRAAVKFGVARYLYRDGVPTFARAPGDGVKGMGAGDPESLSSTQAPTPNPPNPSSKPATDAATPASAPAPAVPSAPSQRTAAAPSPGNGNGHNNPNTPRTGRALFAWTKEQEQRYEIGLLKYLNSWAKLQEFPSRMVDWDSEQVTQAYSEACRKLQAIQSANSEAHEEALAN